MSNKLAIALASCLSLAAAASAQNCSDNTYPIRLVNADGAPFALSGSGSTATALAPTESVYMAFDAALPTGIYLVYVTDPIGGHDEVVSLADVTDRLIQVTNDAGVITLSRPYSVSAEVPAFGAGLNGVGQSMPLFPFFSASWDPCNFKAWLGNSWGEPLDPANPYALRGGVDTSTGLCRVRSYTSFRVGDGTGSDVTGFVFDDANRNGVLDPDESGLIGEEVRLVNAGGSVSVLTDDTGSFRFVDVAIGAYTVEITVTTGSVATTPTSYSIDVCGCSDVAVDGFGQAQECMRCDGHTIGYWRNCHGLRLIADHNLLPQLNSLGLVNSCGQRVSFASLSQFACWLQGANSVNMAYMLSAQLAAMYLNVAVGFVDEDCLMRDACLGDLRVGELMAQAIASLNANGYTPRCHRARAQQERLKNALDDGNNNRNWVNPCSTGSCSTGSCGGSTGGSGGTTCDPRTGHWGGSTSGCGRTARPRCGRSASWRRCR